MSDSDSNRAAEVARLAELNRTFAATVPHNKALGLEMIELAEGCARMRLPWREDLVGNPVNGVLHGGALTALMDACCGAAVFMALRRPKPIATLDLRIDYMMPAAPHEAVLARAECYKVTRNVAFVRCVAYHDDESRLIASAAGAFMLGTKRGSRRPPKEKAGE